MGVIILGREGYSDNTDIQMTCSMADLIRAAITVGKSAQDSTNISFTEKIFRLSSLLLTIEERNISSRNCFVASTIFNSLDPSEKGAMTFFLGMAITKLVAERYFNVQWLMHFDAYRESYDAICSNGGKPDFLGVENTVSFAPQYHIFESKGRTGGLDKGALERGKEQTRYVQTISGTTPISRNVVQAYFQGDRKVLHGYLMDPTGADDGVDEKIDLKNVFKSYYKPFYDLINILGQEENKENNFLTKISEQFEIAYIKPLDIYIGVARGIRPLLEQFSEKTFFYKMLYYKKNIEKDMQHIRIFFSDTEHINFSYGNDGIFVMIGNSYE